jgi:prophage regulatory protein
MPKTGKPDVRTASVTPIKGQHKPARTAGQQQNAPPFPPEHDRVVRVREVCKMLGISRSTFYDAIRREEFPKPKRITGSGRAVGYPLSMVLSWVEILK